MADDLAARDGAPLAAIQDLHMIRLHPLALRNVFLDAGDVEGPGLAEVELDGAGRLVSCRSPGGIELAVSQVALVPRRIARGWRP